MADDQPFRWILGSILLTNLICSGYFRHRARKSGETISRLDEGFGLVALRMALALPVVVCLVAYLINPALVQPMRVNLPVALRWLGVGLTALSLPLVIWTLRNLGQNVSETVLTKRNHQLVRDGPYRYVRHPLYSSGSLLLAGVSLGSALWLVAVMTLLVMMIFRWFIVPKEESALISKFGEAYISYRRQTGAMFPRWRQLLFKRISL